LAYGSGGPPAAFGGNSVRTMKHHPSELGLTTGLPRACVVRTLAPGDSCAAARWDAFVAGCGSATFFHRAGWQQVIAEVFRHRTHFLYAERDGRIEGVLPLARVRSLLFGDAMVSLPFAVYGGVAADTAEAADALEDAAQTWFGPVTARFCTRLG